ncbi:MAG TPA: ROK family protein [Blastocatellia bacterium]
MTAPQPTTNAQGTQEIALAEDARVLAIDIGGSGLKAAILDLNGDLLSERVRIETPKNLVPDALLQALVNLVEPFAAYDVVSVGFPGVVRKGVIITAPNLGTKQLKGYNLQLALEKQLGKPARVLNDADMQGFAAIKGEGVEMVITLGTGFGSALFLDGELAPHLEISHIPFRKGEDYDQQVGNAARKKIGKKRWNRRVQRAIKNLRILTNFDRLYIGGGNADKLKLELEPDIEVISNENGVRGGAWLWRSKVTSKQ